MPGCVINDDAVIGVSPGCVALGCSGTCNRATAVTAVGLSRVVGSAAASVWLHARAARHLEEGHVGRNTGTQLVTDTTVCLVLCPAHPQDVSIVMKGETVPSGAVWRGVPAVPVMDQA